jgi:hypothetical protein
MRLGAWAEDLKEDSIALFRDANVVSRKAYGDAVDLASKKYKKLKNIDARDVERAVKEVKGRWREVSARFSKAKKVVKKTAKKVARR